MFDSQENSAEILESQIHDLLEKHFGFDAAVIGIDQEVLE